MFKVKHDQFYAYDHVLETQADFVQQVMDKHNLYVTRIEDPCAGDGRISQYVKEELAKQGTIISEQQLFPNN